MIKNLGKTRTLTLFSLLLSVTLTVYLFIVAALNSPISFDGGMNLQVAQNIVDNGNYSRYYEFSRDTPFTSWERQFPQEVQTNSVFIFIASFFIKFLGNTQIAYQATNLLFVLLISILIWVIFKKNLIVSIFAPALVLLSLPGTFSYSISGYGEIPALTLALIGFILLAYASVQITSKRILLFLALSLLAVGCAVTIKTMVLGFAPAYIVGFIFVCYLTRGQIKYWKSLLTLPVAAIPLIIFEVYRYISLGSFIAYKDWWKNQLIDIGKQSGVEGSYGTDRESNYFAYIVNSFDKLADYLHLSGIGLAIMLTALVILISYLLFDVYKRGRSSVLLKNTSYYYLVLLCIFFVAIGTYIVWWVLLIPPEKLGFTRRVYPLLFSLLIFIGILLTILWQNKRNILNKFRIFVGVSLVLVLAPLLFGIANSVYNNIDRLQKNTNSTDLLKYESAADVISSGADDVNYYGLDWWSSPTLSLMSNREFHNISSINVCELKTAKNYLIWDSTSKAITGLDKPDLTQKNIHLTHYREAGDTSLYNINKYNCP